MIAWYKKKTSCAGFFWIWWQKPTRHLSSNNWAYIDGRSRQLSSLMCFQKEGSSQASRGQSVSWQRVHKCPIEHIWDQVSDQLQWLLPVRRVLRVHCSQPTTWSWDDMTASKNSKRCNGRTAQVKPSSKRGSPGLDRGITCGNCLLHGRSGLQQNQNGFQSQNTATFSFLTLSK